MVVCPPHQLLHPLGDTDPWGDPGSDGDGVGDGAVRGAETGSGFELRYRPVLQKGLMPETYVPVWGPGTKKWG